MERRSFLIGTTLALREMGASLLGLGVGACSAPTPGPAALRAGVLGGVEEELLRFVASTQPSLALSIVKLGSAAELRHALREGQLSLGSFETAVDAEAEPKTVKNALVSAGLGVTLPLGFYSKKLRRLSELGPKTRVVLPDAPRDQGRALLVLYHYGLIGFDEELGPHARLQDVKQNPRSLALTPVSARRASQELDTGLVALGYRDAAALGLAPARSALAMEDGFSPFAQVLTVRREEQRAPWLLRFLHAYRSPAVKDFILRRYEDSVRRAW